MKTKRLARISIVTVGLWILAAGCGGGGGGSSTAPQLMAADATSSTSVLLTFSEPMQAMAGDPVHYQISPRVVITAADLSEFATQVLLTTLPMTSGVQYAVTASDIAALSGAEIDPAASSVTFVMPPLDSGAPQLLEAVATSQTTVLITFSEAMDESAGDASRYHLQDGVVSDAELSEFKTQVLLTTLPLTLGVPYTVTADVQDEGRNPIDPNHDSATFSHGFETPDNEGPEVLKVIAVDANTMIVMFDEPVGPGAEDPGRYSFAPGIDIRTAERNETNTQVRLTTRTEIDQSTTYNITIDNVPDTKGNSATPSAMPVAPRPDPQVPDVQPPRVIDALTLDATTVVVSFDEPVGPTAADPSKYSLVPGGIVVSAQLGQFQTQVILTVVPLTPGMLNTVNVTNVIDLSGNTIATGGSMTTVTFGTAVVDSAAPRIVRAVPTSATTVLVSFSEPMRDTAGDAANYSLSLGGRVVSAQLNQFKTQVLLNVLPLAPGVTYTVTATAIADEADNAIAANARSAGFAFGAAGANDTIRPKLMGAVITSPTTILASFSEPMAETAADPVRYSLTPGGVITSAEVSRFGTQVLLTTLPLPPGVPLTLTASTVVDVAGNAVDPGFASATLVFGNTVDNRPPQLLRAVIVNSTTIQLFFSEPLGPSAVNPGFYVFSPPVTIINATRNDQNTQVTLTTMPLQPAAQYTINVTNVVDLAGNPIVVTTNVPAVPQTDSAPAELPRVVGAASTSNLTVVVKFSESMSDSALDPSNYFVELQPNVGVLTLASRCVSGPHAGDLCASGGVALRVCKGGPPVPPTPGVEPLAPRGQLCGSDEACGGGGMCESGCSVADCRGARFLDTNRTLVELQTISQNDGIYSVTATGVTDSAGNPLAPRQVVGGAVVDPTTAGFPGTGPVTNGMIPGNAGVDSDGDAMPDTDEQSGWDVSVTLLNGEVSTQHQTANPLYPDTDGEGVIDSIEFSIGTNPRSNDTDGDGLTDDEEYNVVYSDPTNQDTDRDSITDALEVDVYGTNPILDDSDGDGFTDDAELFVMGRNPLISDLPEHQISVGEVRLQIDERFSYVDEQGVARSSSSQTDTSLVNSQQNSSGTGMETGNSQGNTFRIGLGDGTCPGFTTDAGMTPVITENIAVRTSLACALSKFFVNRDFEDQATRVMTVSSESARGSESAYQLSLAKGEELTSSSAVMREITGGRLDASVTVRNFGDIAFALSNLEITALATDPEDRSRLLPVATLLPNSTLISGDPAVFNLGPLQPTRGPILFGNSEVFPNLVEDLMRDPRGLVFQVSNYDITDEAGRNFAFSSQEAKDRTAGLSIDYGDGTVERYRVASNAPFRNPSGDIEGGFDRDTGRPRGSSLDHILQDFLGMRRTSPAVIVAGSDGVADTTAAAGTDDVQVEMSGASNLMADAIVVAPGPNGLLDTIPDPDDDKVAGVPDGIRAGENNFVDSVAQGDDVQLIPAGTLGVPEDTVVISAGGNGVLDSEPREDDRADVVTGYEVSSTCDANTPLRILPGPDGDLDSASGVTAPRCVATAGNGHYYGEPCERHLDCGTSFDNGEANVILAGPNGTNETFKAQLSDDVFYTFPGTTMLAEDEIVIFAGRDGRLQTMPLGDDVTAHLAATGFCRGDDGTTDPGAILPGPDGFIDTIRRGDDSLVAPGTTCVADAECQLAGGDGMCDGPQVISRLGRRRSGEFRRFWALVMPDDSQFQTDVGQILIKPGDTIGLAFIEDRDRDGLIAPVENLFGSSDTLKDTDDDGLDDFAEIKVGWDVGVAGQTLRHVFPDPTQPDSDRDGLLDRDEQDVRMLFAPFGKDQYEDPNDPVDPNHTGDVTGSSFRPEDRLATDPRRRDTDGDSIADAAEVLGYLTGAGIADPGVLSAQIVVAGSDRRAQTRACPMRTCKRLASGQETDPKMFCRVDHDCPASFFCCEGVMARACKNACDDIQVIDPSSPEAVGIDPGTVVVLPGPNRVLETAKDASDAHAATMGRQCVTGPKAGDPCADDSPCLPTCDSTSTRCVGGPSDGMVCTANADCLPKCQSGTCVGGPRQGGSCSADAACNQFCLAVGSTTTVGDDVPLILLGTPTSDDQGCLDRGSFPMCSVAKPGPDGIVQSAPGGDDVLALGQQLETTDPTDPDTDIDQVQDGIERALGSSPNNPADTGIWLDTDRDGLTDNQERLIGWTIEVRRCDCIAGRCPMRTAIPNPYVADSDGDGLPDYAEYFLRTDPKAADTDADGLTDYEEVSQAQLDSLARFNDIFPAFALDTAGSPAYGTNPVAADSDCDQRSDSEELGVGWLVTSGGTAREVFSDPTRADTDGDGLSDRWEQFHRTDPHAADTDGDDSFDGAECREETCISNPQLPDLFVNVRYFALESLGGPTFSAGLAWDLRLQPPNQTFPGESLSATGKNFTAADCINARQVRRDSFSPTCTDTEGTTEYLRCSAALGAALELPRAEQSFALHSGQSFTLSGRISDLSRNTNFQHQCINLEAACTFNFYQTFDFGSLNPGVQVVHFDGTATQGFDVFVVPPFERDTNQCRFRITAVITVGPRPEADSDGDGLTDEQEEIGWSSFVALGKKGGTSCSGICVRGEKLYQRCSTDAQCEATPDSASPPCNQSGGATKGATFVRYSSDPFNADSDGDLVADFIEFKLGTDPTQADTDCDGVRDLQEVGTGAWLPDSRAVCPGYDQLSREEVDDIRAECEEHPGCFFVTSGSDSSPTIADTDCDGNEDSDDRRQEQLVVVYPEWLFAGATSCSQSTADLPDSAGDLTGFRLIRGRYYANTLDLCRLRDCCTPGDEATGTRSCDATKKWDGFGTWQQIENFATTQFGGHLATIRDSQDVISLGSLVPDGWIGLRRSGSAFTWISGAAFNFSAWLPGQPGNDSCAHRPAGWITDNCAARNFGLIEIDPDLGMQFTAAATVGRVTQQLLDSAEVCSTACGDGSECPIACTPSGGTCEQNRQPECHHCTLPDLSNLALPPRPVTFRKQFKDELTIDAAINNSVGAQCGVDVRFGGGTLTLSGKLDRYTPAIIELSGSACVADEQFLFGVDALPAPDEQVRLEVSVGDAPYSKGGDSCDDTGDGQYRLQVDVTESVASGAAVVHPLLMVPPGDLPQVLQAGRQSFDTVDAPRLVAAGDLDGDRFVDAVVSGAAGVTAHFNDGKGRLVKQPSPFSNHAPGSLLLTDLTRDGKLDLVAILAGRLNVFRGTGTRNQPFTSLLDQSLPTLTGVASADFSGDGKPDLLLVYGGEMHIRNGNGDGTFGPEARVGAKSDGLLATGDFNGDGRPDVVTTGIREFGGQLRNVVLFLPGNSSPGLDVPGEIQLVISREFSGLAADDFNGDGKLDVAVLYRKAFSNDGVVEIFNGDGTGHFRPGQPSVPIDFLPSQMAVGDLDGDHRPELAIVHHTANADSAPTSVMVVRDAGDTLVKLPLDQLGATPFGGLTIADFDGDHLGDLAVANQQTDKLEVGFNRWWCVPPGVRCADGETCKVDLPSMGMSDAFTVRGQVEEADSACAAPFAGDVSKFERTLNVTEFLDLAVGGKRVVPIGLSRCAGVEWCIASDACLEDDQLTVEIKRVQ